jgi:uncharacterized protein YdeI (YjbR/CyaY-like superfamily)
MTDNKMEIIEKIDELRDKNAKFLEELDKLQREMFAIKRAADPEFAKIEKQKKECEFFCYGHEWHNDDRASIDGCFKGVDDHIYYINVCDSSKNKTQVDIGSVGELINIRDAIDNAIACLKEIETKRNK